MTILAAVVDQIRQRAQFACEYCGVTEVDSGGLLTVDHYVPRSASGSDDPANLVYCCFRCNLYKGDCNPTEAANLTLWNPRFDSREAHFRLRPDGILAPITAVGRSTVAVLRLNRPELVAYRRRKMQAEVEVSTEWFRLIARLRMARRKQSDLLEKQRELLIALSGFLRLLAQDEEE